MSYWIQTYSGGRFSFSDPQEDMVKPIDIAHALSITNRYGGHTWWPYSVAQHSLIGSIYIEPEYALEFLLHDAPEAYYGDLPKPLKNYLGEKWDRMARKIDRVVRSALGLPQEIPKEIKPYDDAMLILERKYLLRRGTHGVPWDVDTVEGLPTIISDVAPMSSDMAEKAFIKKWKELDSTICLEDFK